MRIVRMKLDIFNYIQIISYFSSLSYISTWWYEEYLLWTRKTPVVGFRKLLSYGHKFYCIWKNERTQINLKRKWNEIKGNFRYYFIFWEWQKIWNTYQNETLAKLNNGMAECMHFLRCVSKKYIFLPLT